MMPGLDGPQVCRRLREQKEQVPTYIILLTALTGKQDIIAGLGAGADDYVTKPFDRGELLARVGVGERVIALEDALSARVAELEEALSHIRTLQGILPICSYCRKVRDDEGYWQQVETYVRDHSEAQFSHGICPECFEQVWATL